jgi:hypothetical protein
MFRFLVLLGIAAVAVVMFWPLLRKLDSARLRAEAAPPSRGGTIFFAIALTLALTFVMSAFLWYFGR